MPQPPKFYLQMKEDHPELMAAYETLSQATRDAGPLDIHVASLVKVGISLGSGLEGATHSSVRKALAAGCSPDEIRHVVILATTTMGFPSMMRSRAWVEDVLKKS